MGAPACRAPRAYSAALEFRPARSRHHATRRDRQSRDPATTILIAPLITCWLRIPVYTLDHLRLHSVRKPCLGLVIQPAGACDVRPYGLGYRQSARCLFLIKRSSCCATYAPRPSVLELPDYKRPRAPRIASASTPAKCSCSAAGTTIFAIDGLSVPGVVPQPPAGAEGPAINYSLAAFIGKGVRAAASRRFGFNWQIAVACDSRHGGARKSRVAALGTVTPSKAARSRRADRTGPRHQMAGLATALSLLACTSSRRNALRRSP